jgi:hypothetical protein
VREGFVKGWPFLIVICIAVALGLLSNRLTREQISDRRARAIAIQQHRALVELCKTQTIVLGLIDGATTLFKYEIGILPPRGFRGPNPPSRQVLINPKLVPAYLDVLNTFLGWSVQLQQQTSCERITHP